MFETKVNSEKEQKKSVTNITEHYSEKERECYHIEGCWVYFFISWNAIGLYYLMERSSKFIQLKKRWWLDTMISNLVHLSNSDSTFWIYLLLDLSLVLAWYPKEANQQATITFEFI